MVKQNNPVDIRVEKLPVIVLAPGTGSAMQEHHRQAISPATFLYVQPVPFRYRYGVCLIGFNRWKQCSHMGN